MRKPRDKHILIVDDDPRVLLILKATLERLGNGYQIQSAGNGQEALTKAENQSFDLIITDVRMPGVDGIQLVEEIRTTNDDTAILWITAHGCHRLVAEREQLNVYSCLEKPLKIDEIRQAALDALDANSNSKKTVE